MKLIDIILNIAVVFSIYLIACSILQLNGIQIFLFMDLIHSMITSGLMIFVSLGAATFLVVNIKEYKMFFWKTFIVLALNAINFIVVVKFLMSDK